MSGPINYYPTTSVQGNGDHGIDTANAPPPTAFSLWAETKRETVRRERPYLVKESVELRLRAMWRDLAPNEKKVFEDNLEKMKKEDKPTCAYILFCADKRKEFTDRHGNRAGAEVTKILASAWNEMSEAAKAPYVKRNAEKRKKYIEKWGATPNEVRNAAKRERAAKRKAPAAAAAENGQPAKRTRENQLIPARNAHRDVLPPSPRSQSQSPLLGSTSSTYYRSSTSPSGSEGSDAWLWDWDNIQPTFFPIGDFPWPEVCRDLGLNNISSN
ncbi:hypothetical protein B9Z55_026385 [Caenorhabditis nigoni]|uniref:HMG box domain-containing protein n=1 Tax=Caenorhabditis nigoni TaxID=1611254 RepID=A0A2G5T2V4_9PELO|nr:hypothetical protein B9Z55_026385 [Caenorhabditis nigoni]